MVFLAVRGRGDRIWGYMVKVCGVFMFGVFATSVVVLVGWFSAASCADLDEAFSEHVPPPGSGVKKVVHVPPGPPVVPDPAPRPKPSGDKRESRSKLHQR